jgi:signal transduction histidine kinase
LVPGPWPLEGGDLASTVFWTGHSVRIDDYHGVPGRIAAFVREELGICSSVASPIVVEARLWGVLFLHSKQSHQPFARNAESRLTGFTELVATAVANAEGRAELVASRARIVAAADEARRRIERDLHDGAQQRLVALAMDLGRARAKFGTDPQAAEAIVGQAHEQAKEALTELRNLVRGMHPPVLTDRGLDAALSGLAAISPVPVTVRVDVAVRPPAPVEAIAYFVVAEALTNVAKHARASRAEVTVTRTAGLLRVVIADDGTGGADPAGQGLSGLASRAAGVDGRLSVSSPAGGPTSIEVLLPCGS